jgi:UDP-N-acetylmuramoyl-L-alanyl-D-glutamate--2,6-diaminopimelate ligase
MAKKLTDILTNCPVRSIVGSTEKEVHSITFDSRKAQAGTAFFAVRGQLVDGHAFIQSAVGNGCNIVFCELLPDTLPSNCTFIQVENSAYSLAMAAANFFDHPSKKLILVGVTGTNGKTTIATLLHQLFELSGYATGLISTICNRIGHKEIPSTHTTPDPIALNSLLQQMVLAGCTYAFMEVSSHAMAQMRTFGLSFSGGIFTNLTHDHLDYHGSFAAYRDAKKLFFDILPKDAFALINADDKNGRFIIQNTKASVYSFGLLNDADFKARVIENQFEGLLMNIQGKEVFTRLIGRFNASNLLAIYSAAVLLKLDQSEVLRQMSLLESAEGRFEFVRSSNQIVGIVDYAHTPDALENVLKTINEIRTRNEKLITVAGAGGDRDRSKRPEMARVAAELSDILILTSDNPRSEKPEEIIAEMRKGVPPLHYKKTLAITDRREAIHAAVSMANTGDIILVAGKGHEKYQEINGVRYQFDDKKELFERLLDL